MNKKVDFLCYEPHFLDHLVPMYLALDKEYKGKFLVRNALINHAEKHKVPFIAYGPGKKEAIKATRERGNLVVAAASGDLDIAAKAGTQAVFTQHGAGQSFTKLHSSYAGWPHHKNVLGFIHPGDHPAERDRRAYKGRKRIFVCGCPKLDRWHRGEICQPCNDLPIVVFSTHWDCKVVPETRSAFYHMFKGLKLLAQRNGKDFTLWGHGHPRIMNKIAPEYEKLGIRVVRSFDVVMRQADLYVMDHMSTLYEFASAGPGGKGRPVVVMNAPGYRREVEHGLRFWSAAHVGLNVNTPSKLLDVVHQALQNDRQAQEDRMDAVSQVYKFTDGKAARRAAEGIMECRDAYIPAANRQVVFRTKLREKMANYFNRPQIPQIAINRIRNFQRGHTPVGDTVQPGINARPGRLFFTDSDHAKELKNLGHSRDPYEDEMAAFPLEGHADEVIEKLDESKMPAFDMTHTGGGYWDITEDGQVVTQVRGKKMAEKHIAKLKKEWKENHLTPQESDATTE